MKCSSALGVLGVLVSWWSNPAAAQPPVRLAAGNLSVDAIQHSPIGPAPDPAYKPQLPDVEHLKQLREGGLQAYEDYVAWGVVEPEEDRWDFSHHEEVYRRVTAAGLVYIPYIWCHVPPAWLRGSDRITLMRCNAHSQAPNQSPPGLGTGQACHILSIYDPRTVEWYARFYRALKKQFGDRLTEVYACLLGPYGEGNYPLPYADFVLNLAHCHEGYWAGDPHALPAFRKAMMEKYRTATALNAAWGTTLKNYDEVAFPAEISAEKIPDFSTRPPAERRRWLDFIRWYHAALVNFSGRVVDEVVKIFGKERVAIKPGGNAGWMNPVSWGTHCPSFAKMAAAKGVAAQLADAHGAYWADQWAATAYAFYGGVYRTEPAGNLDAAGFAKRVFSDAACGASRLFTYEIEKHLPAAAKALPLYDGKRRSCDIAILAPTTMHYLGADVRPAIETGMKLRDAIDYDVLDEQLVLDGALDRYRLLVAIRCRVVEADVLKKILAWVEKGGFLVWAGRFNPAVEDVEGDKYYPMTGSKRKSADGRKQEAGGDTPGDEIRHGAGTILQASADFEKLVGVVTERAGAGPDGAVDSVWTTGFGDRVMLLNLGKDAVKKSVTWKGKACEVELPAGEIVEIH